MKTPRRTPYKRAGFTLVEMLTVLAIIALLSSMALPRFGASIARARADAAARRIAADIELARRRAILKGAAQSVNFDPATDSYSLPGVPHLDHPDATYNVELSELPYEVDLVTASFNSDAIIIFDGFGVPDSGGAIRIQVGGNIRDLTIDADTGQTTIVEP